MATKIVVNGKGLVVEKRNGSPSTKTVVITRSAHNSNEGNAKPMPTNEYTQETRDASPAHLLTQINSFSLLSKHKIGVLESTEFVAGDYKWKVRIYLHDQVSVRLSMVGTDTLPAGWEVNGIFNFFLYNHISNNYLCFRGKARRFHAIDLDCEFCNLITKDSLIEVSNGYVSDDKCVFGAEVFVIEQQPSVENVYKGELDLSKTSKLETNVKSSAGGNIWSNMIYPNGSLRACKVDSNRGKKVNAATSFFCFSPKTKPHHSKEEHTLEIRDAPPAHLLTTIESFSMLLKNKIKFLESTEFEIGDYKWKVKINLDEGSNISVYLCMVETSFVPAGGVNVIFNLFLFNHIADKYHCFRGKGRRFHAMNPEWGFAKFISKKKLTDPSNGYLSDDKCVFGAEVFVIKNPPIIEHVSALNLTDPLKCEWKISKFSKLEEIWKSEEFSAGGYKWQMKMYPKGCKGTCGQVSIFLECVDAYIFGDGKKVHADYTLRFKNMLNCKGNHSLQVKRRWFSSTSQDWGFTEFIAITDLRDPSKGLLVDDCCTVEIQLSVLALQELM